MRLGGKKNYKCKCARACTVDKVGTPNISREKSIVAAPRSGKDVTWRDYAAKSTRSSRGGEKSGSRYRREKLAMYVALGSNEAKEISRISLSFFENSLLSGIFFSRWIILRRNTGTNGLRYGMNV